MTNATFTDDDISVTIKNGMARFTVSDGRSVNVVVGIDDAGDVLLTLEPDASTTELAGEMPGEYYLMPA